MGLIREIAVWRSLGSNVIGSIIANYVVAAVAALLSAIFGRTEGFSWTACGVFSLVSFCAVMVSWYSIWRYVSFHRLADIIEKRAGAANLLREFSDRFGKAVDAKDGKRKLARNIFSELSPHVLHLCGHEMHKRWLQCAEIVGEIDDIETERIDDCLRCYRDWLIQTAKGYEQQADDMRRTGVQH